MNYEIFYVVNDNVKTINPATGEKFTGMWCQRNGWQGANPKDATPYYTRKGAQALINKLNKGRGMSCPQWARVARNTDSQLGLYRIVEGTVTLP